MCYNPHNESEVIANSLSFRVPFEMIKKMFVKYDNASASQVYVEEKMTQTVCSKK